MDKELPTSGSGRSAFNMFGFGNSDRYTNFDSPLESGEHIESFNATNSIAFPSRPSSKSKKQNSSGDNVGDAYKICLKTTSNSSQLLLQSLSPSSRINARTNPGADFPDVHHRPVGISSGLEKSVGRRYSDAQSSHSRDTAEVKDGHTDHLLQKFSSTVHLSHSKVPGHNESGGEQRALISSGGMRRQGSSPVLSSMAHQQGSIMQGFLKRNASSGSLYTVNESSASDTFVPVSQNSLSANNTGTISAAAGALQKVGMTSPHQVTNSPLSSNVDSLDSSGTQRKGFGILGRTRQFGTWLGKVTHGEKVEVSKKDVNVFAPTSF